MKTINKHTIEMAKQLASVIELRKELDKQERELKDSLINFMGPDEMVLEAGTVTILRKERTRTDLDRKMMVESLWLDTLKRFEKTSRYFILEVVEKRG